MIDKHNQARQVQLALEKRWLTQNPFFCLHTILLGIKVVDCYKWIIFFDYLLLFYSHLPQELWSLMDGAAPDAISIVNESPEST